MIVGGVKFKMIRQAPHLPYLYEASYGEKKIEIKRTPNGSNYRVYINGRQATERTFDYAEKAALFVLGKVLT